MRTVAIVLALVAATLAATPGLAQQANKPAAPRAPVVYDMDEDLILGGLEGPTDHVVRSKHRTQFRSLIEVRADFRREVLQSGERL